MTQNGTKKPKYTKKLNIEKRQRRKEADEEKTRKISPYEEANEKDIGGSFFFVSTLVTRTLS